jgi:ABC-type proline/glycine betaine transport system ATPase subunit
MFYVTFGAVVFILQRINRNLCMASNQMEADSSSLRFILSATSSCKEVSEFIGYAIWDAKVFQSQKVPQHIQIVMQLAKVSKVHTRNKVVCLHDSA